MSDLEDVQRRFKTNKSLSVNDIHYLFAVVEGLTLDRDNWMGAQLDALDAITELRRQLAEGQNAYRVWSDAASLAAVKLAAAEAREKALRAITGEMSPHPRVWDDAWSNCCAEWDRRAGGIV